MKIDVTGKDIRNGVRKIADSCPIALAVQRAFPDKGIEVDDQIIGVYAPGESQLFKTPLVAKEFIALFDGGTATPEPFSFDLDDQLEPRDVYY